MTWTIGWTRWRWAVATAVLVVLGGAVGWVLAGNLDSDGAPEPALVAVPTGAPSAARATPRPTATAEPALTPTPPVPTATPVRLVIAAIDVDAPITVKGLLADAVMDVPNGPEDVAWYSFTARPGARGNAVFSGHLDYHDYGTAVFWRLKDLQEGDVVEVSLDDGSVLRYRVSLKVSYDARTAPVLEILGPTSKEVVTLITCDGSFDGGSRSYSHRLVVRAERI